MVVIVKVRERESQRRFSVLVSLDERCPNILIKAPFKQKIESRRDNKRVQANYEEMMI